MRGEAPPQFYAFGPNGAGTFGECSATPPTGARGELLTFGRSTPASCLGGGWGLRTTGIQPGDMKVLAANQPRVERDSSGVLGLRFDVARTNSCTRSEEIDNGTWVAAVSGLAPPTVTANAAVPPNNTSQISDAERVQIPACPVAGNHSVLLQTLSVSNPTGSCFVRGVSGSGSFTLFARDASAAASAVCNYVSSSWSRCSVVFSTAASTQFGFGCLNAVSPIGGTNTGAADFYVWGCQFESGSPAGAYDGTSSSGVTRTAESAKMAILPGPAATAGSISVYTDIPGAISDTGWAALEGTTGWQLIGFGAGANRFHATAFLTAVTGPTVGLSKRSAGGDGTSSFACSDATCATGAAVTTTGVPTYFWLADYNVGFPGSRVAPGIYTRPCWDPTARCR